MEPKKLVLKRDKVRDLYIDKIVDKNFCSAIKVPIKGTKLEILMSRFFRNIVQNQTCTNNPSIRSGFG